MLIQRTVYSIKPGTSDEVVELLRPYFEREKNALKCVMLPKVAPDEHVVLEWAWDSLAAMEQGWAEWQAEPETSEFRSRWVTFVTGGVVSEVWEVAE